MYINEITPKEIVKGYKARFVHTESHTIAFWEVEAGAEIPIHSHFHEQTMVVNEGKFEFTLNNETKIYEAGMFVNIPPHAKHGGKAITNCKLTDIFCPVREDYK
ncbi:MAG: cupin domain-containing protein [Flavobacteriaceae bacterium]|nr:cupin domain-containing protein [Flavobacteriaceae bacterium]